MTAPAAKGIRDSMYLLALFLYSGDGQVPYIERYGLRYRIQTYPFFYHLRFNKESLLRKIRQLERWGYLSNINTCNKGEIRFSLRLPNFAKLQDHEPTDVNRNYL